MRNEFMRLTNRNCARDRVGQGGQAVRQEGRGRQSMMDKALRDRLIADPAISAIVGTRVYWIDRPQSASALPAIVLQKVSPGRTYSPKGATTLQGQRVQFDLLDRKSVVEGKSVSVRVDLGGRRRIKTKIHT